MYYVYAIKSQSKNYIYVGLTNNIERRISQHNRMKEKTTRQYAPFDLIFSQLFSTRTQARTQEKKLKSGCGKEFLRSLIDKSVKDIR